MTAALFRLALPDGSIRLAAGDVESGPVRLLDPQLTIAAILRRGNATALTGAIARGADRGDAVPRDVRVLAPVDEQEVWAAGVTYERSRDARMEESTEASVYDHVYAAERPELFFKAAAWRVRGPGETIGVRRDSDWNVPEPELALVVTAGGEIAGYTIGNDVSSRTIEGENPLYLPQAKVYDGACALGPALVPAAAARPPFPLRLVVERAGSTVVDAATSTARIRRPLEELVGWLCRALELPAGAILLTGTGVVPETPFTLTDGDRVRIDGGPLGVLENPVVSVGSPAARRSGAQPTRSR